MTTRGFTVSHARDARFERGLRGYYAYRGLGIKEATDGKIDVHVIRAVPGEPFSSEPHVHRTSFQFVYVLKGWIELEYEEYGVQRFEAGSSVFQPPSIRHREVGHSDDVEMIEVVMPADFETALVDSLQG